MNIAIFDIALFINTFISIIYHLMYFTIQNRINYFNHSSPDLCYTSLIENKEDIMIKLIALDMDGTLLNEKKS